MLFYEGEELGKFESEQFENIKQTKFGVVVDIIRNSILLGLPLLCTVLKTTISFILIGNYSNLQDLISIQIGILYLNFFGYFLIYGSLNIFTANALHISDIYNDVKFQKLYMKAKYTIYFYILMIVVPMSLFSYYIFDLLLFFDKDENTLDNATHFIHLGIFIVLVNSLKNLNYKVLYLTHRENWIRNLSLLSIAIHFGFSFLFVNFLDSKIDSIAYSLFITDFTCFVISTVIIKKSLQGMNIFFSGDFNITFSSLRIYIKTTFYEALLNFFESSYLTFILFFSIFLDNISFATNIIMYNAISLFIAVFAGITAYYAKVLYLKSEHDRKIYNHSFIFLSLFISFLMSIVLLILKNNLGYIYVSDSQVSENFIDLVKFYSICIFIDYMNLMCDEYIKGNEIYDYLHILIPSVYLIIVLPISLLISFRWEKGFYGFWIGYFIFITTHLLIDLYFIIKDYVQNIEIW